MDAYHLFLTLLSIYIGFLVLTGIYFSKKQPSQIDFWLAGRSAGVFSIGCSAAASWLTASALLAVTGFYMLLGMGSVWDFVAPNILALFIIAFFVKKIKSLPAVTQPELLEMRYGPHLRMPVALILTIVMILIVGLAKAEPALLTFIMDSKFSDVSLAVCAVSLQQPEIAGQWSAEAK